METQLPTLPRSSRDYMQRVVRQGGRYNIIYNSDANQWTAHEAEESTQHHEYLETEPSMELLEVSHSHISAPIRPYHQSRMRMRRDAA